ncbi:hypothetical protein [Mycobacteroides salmoniphilum]|uniref:hypothetical protein n=1 Tax=Mycobacteroides salmoniphilum TaxID=404941 RepID=UPI0010AA0F43|nr:hypothetical protein [Mycobacteroides salmoniphilum]QCH25837.1 hypothetical protein DSM43276_04123 [Mycobacteroides salmoniphilum]
MTSSTKEFRETGYEHELFTFVSRYKSPVALKYYSILPQFFERVQEQEDAFSAAGLPAQGLAAFLRDYMHAWDQDDYTKFDLRRALACVTEDMVFTLSATFKFQWKNHKVGWSSSRLATVSSWLLYALSREVIFGPMSDSRDDLPVFDFHDNIVRIAMPWGIPFEAAWSRWIPRFLQVGPLRRCWLITGMDRYVMRHQDGEWRIARIDTDWDMAQALVQLLPIHTPVF